MRFMMMVHGNADYENGAPPPPALMEAIGELGARARAAGKMVMDGGLWPSRAGMRVRMVKGRTTFTDGPFPETKELIGGFAIFDLESVEEAKAMAQQFLDAHARCGVLDLSMEVRRMFGPDDFGACPTTGKATAEA